MNDTVNDRVRDTPLLAEHEALGATFTEFAGWRMPLRYASELAEHRAVRTAAGLFDLSHMGEIRVSGPTAAADLDAALVGWLSRLAVGRARYTMLCDEAGGVLDDLVVYRTGEDDFLVVANAANHDVVLAALGERCAPGAVRDETATTALLAVQGPAAAGIVAALAGPEGTGLGNYAATSAVVAGAAGLVARTGYTGEDGFELYVPAGSAATVWRAALAAGAGAGLVPVGLAARDTLRLEAGMPLYGHELDRTTTPFEAGLGRVVRLDKTGPDGAPLPFVGRAPLAARAGSNPARVLVGLRVLGRRPVRHGDVVLTTKGGATVGTVTSGAPSPTLGHPIALAYVTPEVSRSGSRLVVDVRGRAEAVEVANLPFYRRSRAETATVRDDVPPGTSAPEEE